MIGKLKPSQIDLFDMGGAAITSHWTTGSGRHTKKRSVPDGATKFMSRYIDHKDPPWVLRKFREHPKAQTIIAFTDKRTLLEVAIRHPKQETALEKFQKIVSDDGGGPA